MGVAVHLIIDVVLLVPPFCSERCRTVDFHKNAVWDLNLFDFGPMLSERGRCWTNCTKLWHVCRISGALYAVFGPICKMIALLKWMLWGEYDFVCTFSLELLFVQIFHITEIATHLYSSVVSDITWTHRLLIETITNKCIGYFVTKAHMITKFWEVPASYLNSNFMFTCTVLLLLKWQKNTCTHLSVFSSKRTHT